MKNGVFITFEGCEGAGKSTQIHLLCEWLKLNKIDFVSTREPGGSIIAEKVRDVIMDSKNENMSDICEAMLYSAARAQHLADIVIPALNAGKLVICDRFTHSTFAYQGYAKGLGTDYITKLNALATFGIIPDATLFLDLHPDEAFVRKGGKGDDRMERLSLEFHKKVYEGYSNFFGEPDFIRIDASGTKQETHEKIISAVSKLLNL